MSRPTYLLSDAVLLSRRAELRRIRHHILGELSRVENALAERGLVDRKIRVVEHGTDSGYYTHLRRWKTPPCDPCTDAHRKAEARRRERRRQAKAASKVRAALAAVPTGESTDPEGVTSQRRADLYDRRSA